MGWDRGKYYTRSRRLNGRVVREYVGTGQIGELAARQDAADREKRRAEKARADEARLAAERHDADLAAVERLADLLVRASLVAAGRHQHHRGEWRCRRDSRKPVQDRC
jgi:hypothetical protein